jgi:APA family basic amino acid/polyamine antiporter
LLSSCALLVAAGVIWLRIREPALARPFRCWGYPLTPAIFIAVDGWMIVHTAIAQPLSLAFSLATIALGLLGWWGLARAPGAESAPAR